MIIYLILLNVYLKIAIPVGNIAFHMWVNEKKQITELRKKIKTLPYGNKEKFSK